MEEIMLKDFFQHFPLELTDKYALKMIHKKIEEAEEYHKDGKDYRECLYKVKMMIDKLLEELGYSA